MTDKVKKLVLLNLPYLIFVYLFDKLCQGVRPVSYTHLDVYKRQGPHRSSHSPAEPAPG